MQILTSEQAQQQLETHLQEIIAWHFSAETGCVFWLDWAKKNFDPRTEIKSFADMVKFPHFQDEWLRDLQPEVWVPAAFKGQPYNIFETGGTTGMPKQRIGWTDYKTDEPRTCARCSMASRRRRGPVGPIISHAPPFGKCSSEIFSLNSE